MQACAKALRKKGGKKTRPNHDLNPREYSKLISTRVVKVGYLLGFLESVPEVSAKLKEPNTKEQKFEDVVRSAEQAAVLVLVY